MSTEIKGYFIDDKGNKRDLREIDQVIDEVVFPKPTPEQAAAFAEFYKSLEGTKPDFVYDIPSE